MFWRRRGVEVDEESEEPARAPRGPGGGRIRKRPTRRRLRQPMGAGELLTYAVIVFVLAFLVERFLLGQPWVAALISAAFAGVLVSAWQVFFENRKRRRDIARALAERKKRR